MDPKVSQVRQVAKVYQEMLDPRVMMVSKDSRETQGYRVQLVRADHKESRELTVLKVQ